MATQPITAHIFDENFINLITNFFLSNLLFQSIKKTVHPHSLQAVDTWLKTATDKGNICTVHCVTLIAKWYMSMYMYKINVWLN